MCAVVFSSCFHIDPAIKYPQMVADLDPVSAGTIEAEFNRLFSSKLNKLEVETIFYPRENAVVLEFRYQTIRYRQFWDREGRQLFIQALNRYKEDYASRNLNTRFNRTRSIYGKTKGKAEWETFRFSGVHYSLPTMELGYRFVGEAPYFSVLQNSAPEENVTNDEHMPDSLRIIIHFTRAQAEELAAIFDQDHLMSLLGPAGDPAFVEPAQDEYGEYEEEEF
jgi:hypothetical protein